jgi:hypothetical protein
LLKNVDKFTVTLGFRPQLKMAKCAIERSYSFGKRAIFAVRGRGLSEDCRSKPFPAAAVALFHPVKFTLPKFVLFAYNVALNGLEYLLLLNMSVG